jgi:hypothetical protein
MRRQTQHEPRRAGGARTGQPTSSRAPQCSSSGMEAHAPGKWRSMLHQGCIAGPCPMVLPGPTGSMQQSTFLMVAYAGWVHARCSSCQVHRVALSAAGNISNAGLTSAAAATAHNHCWQSLCHNHQVHSWYQVPCHTAARPQRSQDGGHPLGDCMRPMQGCNDLIVQNLGRLCRRSANLRLPSACPGYSSRVSSRVMLYERFCQDMCGLYWPGPG